MNHAGFGAQLCFPHRPQKIDFQFQGGETLAIGQRAAISRTHRGIGDITQHSAVKRPHRIRVALGGFEFDDRSAIRGRAQPEPEALADC
jgi:hypothetical protein